MGSFIFSVEMKASLHAWQDNKSKTVQNGPTAPDWTMRLFIHAILIEYGWPNARHVDHGATIG
ncbi:hypothetical protein T4C_3162 [Trichinella pseudospiralis]|uniref:Uncharacterized protein n=1 Tax=Trichinella pseudospiralis TaxID=6337 RepID=A0A0V1IZD4_TRIPS|nr:hypothetical protein T4C_3162 [Trichinella pseudospiralis]